MRLGRSGGLDVIDSCVPHLHVPDRAGRRLVADTHARRAHDAHIRTERVRQFVQQTLRAHHRAGEAVAYPHGDSRWRNLMLLHDVEVRIEGRNLVDLGQRKLHFLRKGCKMRGGEMAIVVLDQMQMLDQQIAPARPVDKQIAHLRQRLRIDLAPFRRARRPAAARFGRGASAPRGVLGVHCCLRGLRI